MGSWSLAPSPKYSEIMGRGSSNASRRGLEVIVMSTMMGDFKVLCDEIKLRESETYGYNEIEDILVKMLSFIKSHSGSRREFVAFFLDKIACDGEGGVVYGNYAYLIQVIQFCMRELRWPEIKNMAIKRKNTSSDWRVLGL